MSKDYKIDGRPATIYRTIKNSENPFVMIDSRPVGNPKLSFKAKGILTYLMSRPDGWEVSVADLVKRSTDGEASVRAGLKELKDAGHMRYTTSRNQGRITGWLIEVYEVPNAEFMNTSPDGDFLHVEKQDVENLHVENQTQVLKTLSNKELNNNVSGQKPSCPIMAALEENKIDYKKRYAMLGDMIDEWKAVHADEWIIKAIKMSAGNSINYADGILRRWETDGYPAARKSPPKQTPPRPIRSLD